MDNIVDEGFLAGVDVAHKLVETSAAEEFLGVGVAVLVKVAQVGENESHAGIEVSQVTQAGGKNVVFVDGSLCENCGIGVKLNGCSMLIATVTNDVNVASGLAVGILLAVDFTATTHLGTQIIAQGVNTTNTHTVQTARHLVRALVKLTAGM